MIVAALLRITTVQALRGATVAGAKVTDSSIEALSSIMTDAQQPVILVRIDQSEEAGRNEGLFARSATVTLSIDLLVASKLTYVRQDGEGEVTELVVHPTDAGLEFSLDLLDRQWRRALSSPGNAFAEAFRSLVAAFGPIKSSRGIDPETGRKHAVRMIEVDIEPVCDPAPGEWNADDGNVIAAALTLIETMPDYAEAVAIMRDELQQGATLLSWQKLQSSLMTTKQVPGMLGVAPPDALPPEGDYEEAVTFETMTPVINEHEGAPASDILPDPDHGGPL